MRPFYPLRNGRTQNDRYLAIIAHLDEEIITKEELLKLLAKDRDIHIAIKRLILRINGGFGAPSPQKFGNLHT